MLKEIVLWLRELRNPRLKCDRIGHKFHPFFWEGFVVPSEKNGVADRIRSEEDKCRRCLASKGNYKFVEQDVLHGLTLDHAEHRRLNCTGSLTIRQGWMKKSAIEEDVEKSLSGVNTLHRDDLDYKVAEDIVEELQKEYPGCKIVFVGDVGEEIPKEVQESLLKVEKNMQNTLAKGVCYDCSERIPAKWPVEDDDHDWSWPKGWGIHTDLKGIPMFMTCGLCDPIEEEDEEQE